MTTTTTAGRFRPLPSDTAYLVRLSMFHRRILARALEAHIAAGGPNGAAEIEAPILLGMLTDLPSAEQEHPGIIHDFSA